MSCGIYKITNTINGKCYIGQSLNIERRWREHIRDYEKSDYVIYRAIRKYGIDNFSFEKIIECEKESLDNLEIECINKYNSYVHFENSNGYNETTGGAGIIGYIHTDNDIEKARINRILSIRYKDGIVKKKELVKKLKESPYSNNIRIDMNLKCGEIAIIQKRTNNLIRCISLDELSNMDMDDVLYDSIETMEGNETMEELCDYWREMGLYSSYEEFFD